MESKINVTVRVKPLSEQEKGSEKNNLWNLIGDNTIFNVRTKEMFSFDNVFGDGVSTQEIFDLQVKELVNTAMEGINVTVFAYGQTSSGKTFTMRGYEKKPGLIPLSIGQVFSYMEQDSQREYQISVSYLEIYNETLNDLIDNNNKNLEIRESIAKGIYINRLKECDVKTRQEVIRYMEQGEQSRIIAETKLNEQSSRSHTVFRINIQSKPMGVDLAGSEGASRTETQGIRLREGSNINRSLLALSNVINRLSQANSGKAFINYRDSKLTRILQPALGGNSKTAIICTMTQTLSNYQETLNTLHFGQKAKHVKTTVNVNEISQISGSFGPEMEKAQKEINELRTKLKEYENKVMELQNSSISKIEQLNQNSQMMIDTSSEKLNMSGMSTQMKDNDFTVIFLKDQLKFLTDKVKKATQELEEKERVIQKLEHEKREYQRNFENLELENFQMQEKITQIQNSTAKFQTALTNLSSECFKTPNVSKQQNKRVLEEDGIECFDLDNNNSLSLNGDNDLLRMSIGVGGAQQNNMISQGVDDQLRMWQELERVKRENETLLLQIQSTEKDKKASEGERALKEELEILKEEVLIKEEELTKYQRHCNSISDEIINYLTSSHRETTKIIKDENDNLKQTIMKLRDEIKQMELEKSKQESVKAELEYNHRASEYNVEILKNQIENLNNEISLMRRQNEKQKKTIEIIRTTNERLSSDLEHYKKLSLKNNRKSANAPEGQRDSINALQAPPSLQYQQQQQQIIMMPPPSVETTYQEVQVNLIDLRQLQAKEAEIQKLESEMDERQRKIDDLEKQMIQLNQTKVMSESEALKKLRFDNQILMNKLSEYKKAEKGAKEIVTDYEQMKMKYFNVLTENSNQKTQIQDLIQSKLDYEIAIKDLKEERDKLIDELYSSRMDIKKKYEELAKRQSQVQMLEDELQNTLKRTQELAKKEKEVSQLQSDIESFLKFFTQVDKHLRTLIKFLRDFIMKCNDPKLIEHNQKQIKTIESLLGEVKKTIANREYSGETSRLIESLFLLSSESLKDVQTSAILSDKERAFGLDLDPNMIKQSASNKRKKITHESDVDAILKESKSFLEPKENRYLLGASTQPFSFNLESAGEEASCQRDNGPGGNNSSCHGSKKKRSNKINDKAVSYKKVEFEGNIRRSERIKDKGGMTESDCN